jgi:ABC-type branched-subunit amino acid transport system ATPase component
MTPALAVEGVGHAFSDLVALDDVTPALPAGEVRAVLGPDDAR